MGCKQTTAKAPSFVLATSPPLPNTPIYIKSALKNSHVNGKRKTEKLSLLKQKPSTLSKSVNFDEKVRVKLRTPTPNQTQYENTLSAKIRTQQTPNNDDDDDDDYSKVSSISSQEDIHNEQIRISSLPSTPPSTQRTQPNGAWYKNNSIAVIPSTNNIKEKNQQPPVTITTNPTENLDLPAGTRFRVRRKIQQSVLPETSNPIDPNQLSSTAPSYRSPVPQSPLSVQRPLSNTNAVLIEHRAPVSNDKSSPQPAYYAFSRRATDKTISTEK